MFNVLVGHTTLVAMALLLRGEMKFLWQHREEALQDLEKVTEMSDVDKEVIVTMVTITIATGDNTDQNTCFTATYVHLL